MKKSVLTILFTAAVIFAHAQELGDTKIIVTTGKSAQENYVNLGRHLVSKDFVIKEKDDTFYTLNFEPIKVHYSIKRYNYWRYLILSTRSEDNRIVVTAQYKSGGARKSSLIYNPEKTDITSLFDHINESLQSLGELSYSK